MPKTSLRGAAALAVPILAVALFAASPAAPTAADRGAPAPEAVTARPQAPSVPDPAPGASSGPDVIVGALTGTTTNGSLGGPRYWGTSGGMRAYSIGTTSCNTGDTPLDWWDNAGGPGPTHHPVIAQNLYRLMTVDGTSRFEQIGMSWLKHGFCALQGGLCATAEQPCQPVGGGCEDELGPGCSDPYGASLNGTQGELGPRFQVHAAEGRILVWPHSTPGSGTLNGRIQVPIDDLDPALNPGARYFAEGQYLAEDDALASNDNNNASYREVEVDGVALPYVGPTVQESPAIQAWQDIDPTVQRADVDVQKDGRFHLAWQATQLAGNVWRYEYAVHNLNSHRSAESFTIPLGSGVTVSNVGWHGVNHHSGEPYATDPWTWQVDERSVTWRTVPYDQDVDANALRWGTQFNFRFDANAPPVTQTAVIDLFRPQVNPTDPVVAEVSLDGPGDGIPCYGDTDNDGQVGGSDLVNVILDWGSDGSANNGDVDGSGTVDGQDLVDIILAWGPC